MTDRRTAFVTGGARGLGLEIARALGRDGFGLYLVDVLADRLDQAVAELRSAGCTVKSRVVDVSDQAQCQAAVADCVAVTGNLSVLVNNAGIMRMEPFASTTAESWNRILGVNLSGPFYLTQAALPHILEAKGNVVMVASSNGLTGTPYTGPYSATKAALISLTKTLAMEYVEHPVRINAVCPGPMATEIAGPTNVAGGIDHAKVVRYSGQRGLADAARVADVIAFLASDAAAAVHGAIWTADLGASAG